MKSRNGVIAGMVCALVQLAWAVPVFAGTMVAYDDTYYCLKNRQKFIRLRGFHIATSGGISDLDDAINTGTTWTVNSQNISHTPQLQTGQSYSILGTAPNLCYIPPRDWTGTVTIGFTVAVGSDSDDGVVTVEVNASFKLLDGVQGPSFGITESHASYGGSATYDYSDDEPTGPVPYRKTDNGTPGDTSDDNPYTHYINLETGNDTTGGNHGSPQAPRATIPSNLPPGSVVEIHGVETTAGTPWTITVSNGGSANLPVYIRGANATSKPVMKRGLNVESDYVIIENIEFDAKDINKSNPETKDFVLVKEKKISAGVWEMFHHVAVRHCYFHDYPTGVSLGASAINFRVLHDSVHSPNDSTHLTEHCVVYDVEIAEWGDWQAVTTIDLGGVAFHINTKNGWVVDSHIHHVQSHGVTLSRTLALSQQAPPRDIYVCRNVIHHPKEYGVGIKHGVKVAVTQNKIWRVRSSASSQGSCVAVLNHDRVQDWPYPDNVWIIWNECYDAQRGIHSSFDSSGITESSSIRSRMYAVTNLVHHILPYLARCESSYGVYGFGFNIDARTEAWVFNNTLFKCSKAIKQTAGAADDTLAQYSTTIVQNNVVLDVPDCVNCPDPPYTACAAPDDFHVWVSRNAFLDYFGMDYNLHYGNIRFVVTGQSGTHKTNVADVNVLHSWLNGSSIESDPLLTSTSALNFRPTSSSPCKNAGIDDTMFDEFNTVFGVLSTSIRKDLDGNVFTGTTVPIGAFK